MQINVYILNASNDCRPTFLLVPDRQPKVAIPRHLQAWEWHYLFTTVSDDQFIGRTPIVVDEMIQRDGFMIIQRERPDI
ncbi:hypothetical protein [Devosia riboflavina]|jgi:hypothetical protein